MIRNSKVGDSVYIKPRADKRIDGAIIAIEPDGERLRTVATDEGHHFVTPQEMWESDEPPRIKAVEELQPGDVIVLFNGTRRTIETVAATGSPMHYRMIFAETDKVLTFLRRQEVAPGTLFRVIEQ